MCVLKPDPACAKAIEVALPLAGPIVALLGMWIALLTVVS